MSEEISKSTNNIQLAGNEDTSVRFCLADNREMLRVDKDCFFVRGVKVEQGPGEAREVYEAFVAWLRGAGWHG